MVVGRAVEMSDEVDVTSTAVVPLLLVVVVGSTAVVTPFVVDGTRVES
mgnify:CR=1 FL=1